MSDSVGLSTAPLADAEKTDVRRFCGYPMYGPGASGFVGDRFFQAYGLMEYRMVNASPAELQVIRQYLANLYVLEAALPAASATLNVDTAAVFKRNASEIIDRTMLLDMWRRRLCSFMGVPPGEGLPAGGPRFCV